MGLERVNRYYTEALMLDRYRNLYRNATGKPDMAGIGFELRKILSRDSYTATLRAYVYAGLISSGPWVLSIISVMLIGAMSLGVVAGAAGAPVLVSVTYLMAASLILTGGAQLFFTRFISDRLFEKRQDCILPNLVGILLMVTVASGVLGFVLLSTVFDQPFGYRLLMLANFVVLCNLWLTIIFLSGMKAYNRILLIMVIGYSLMVLCAYLLRFMKLEGLLLDLLIGHASLFFMFLFDILREYPARRLVAFDFLERRQVFLSLLVTGLCYNTGIWIDKILFWFNPSTSSGDRPVAHLDALRPADLSGLRRSSRHGGSSCVSRRTSRNGTSASYSAIRGARRCSTSASSSSR